MTKNLFKDSNNEGLPATVSKVTLNLNLEPFTNILFEVEHGTEEERVEKVLQLYEKYKTRTTSVPEKPTPTPQSGTGFSCPKLPNATVYDNRGRKREGKISERAPDLRALDKKLDQECPGWVNISKETGEEFVNWGDPKEAWKPKGKRG